MKPVYQTEFPIYEEINKLIDDAFAESKIPCSIELTSGEYDGLRLADHSAFKISAFDGKTVLYRGIVVTVTE